MFFSGSLALFYALSVPASLVFHVFSTGLKAQTIIVGIVGRW
jgi:hypothetical protein